MANIVEPYVHVKERVRETPTLLPIDGTTNIGGVVVSPKGQLYQYIEGPQDFLDKLVGADELPRNAHVSLINAYYCSFFSGLVIARSLNTLATQAVLIDLGESSSAISVTKLHMIKDTILNASAYMYVNSSNLMNSGDSWAFIINNTCYYNASESEYNNYIAPYLPGASKSTAIRVNTNSEDTILSSILLGINSWAGFNGQKAVDPLFNSESNTNRGESSDNIQYESNLLVEFHDPYVPCRDASEYIVINPIFYYRKRTQQFDALKCIGTSLSISEGETLCTISDLVKITRSSRIAIKDKYLLIHMTEPSSLNEYIINFDKVTSLNRVYNMSIIKDDVQSIYQVSLDKDGETEDGENCFIENLNSVLSDLQFTIVDPDGLVIDFNNNTGLTERLTTGYFGDSGVDLEKCKEPAYLSAAVYRLGEQKDYRIEYLSEFGVTDSEYIKDYTYVGEQNYWFTPVTLPYNYSNASAMLLYGNGLRNSNNILVAGPFDKNSTFLGWPCKIAFTSLYYERVYNNRALGSEYAPCFEETNGVLNYRNPITMLGVTDRTALLNGTSGPIDSVVYNRTENTYYLNDNRCHTTTHNVMDEEMNRRMINRMKKDVIQIMNRFKGMTNTNSTREQVEAILRLYMNQYIMTQNYKPEEYQVICDTTNNTVEIITANKLAVTLRVRLLGSIKYIDVLVDIFPLGIDFES